METNDGMALRIARVDGSNALLDGLVLHLGAEFEETLPVVHRQLRRRCTLRDAALVDHLGEQDIIEPRILKSTVANIGSCGTAHVLQMVSNKRVITNMNSSQRAHRYGNFREIRSPQGREKRSEEIARDIDD